MREIVGYGVDFGTTNSLIAVAYADGVEVVDIEDSGTVEADRCLPSIVYFDHDDHRFAGAEAVRQYVVTARHSIMCGACRPAGVCTKYEHYHRPRSRGQKRGPAPRCSFSRLAYGLKQNLANEAYSGTESWGRQYSLEDMCSWVFSELASRAAVSGRVGSIPVVMGAPVEFDRQRDFTSGRRTALARLTRSAKIAGLNVVEFLGEPEAALHYEKHELGSPAADPVAVAVDFGGGTFDVAVSCKRADPWSSTATAGVPIGGERFDGYLFNEYLLPELGLERAHRKLLSRLSSLRDMAMNAGRDELNADLRDLEARGAGSEMRAVLESGFVYDLWMSIRDAKVRLSDSDESHIDFHKAGIDIRVPVKRSQFETLIREDLDDIREVILRAVCEAGAQPADVSVVLRTGGSSSIPAFIEMLHELFPNAEIHDRPTMTTIAKGLAHRVRERAGVAEEPTRAKVASREDDRPRHPAEREAAAGASGMPEEAVEQPAAGLVEKLRRMMKDH